MVDSRRLTPFLDTEGRIKQFPTKREPKVAVLRYLADKFEWERDYAEKEVNEICDRWHTFGDYFLLRRSLVDYRLLGRERNGSRYWRTGDPGEWEERERNEE